MLAKEKEKEKEKAPTELNLQSVQDTLAGIQDFMQKTQTQIKTQLETNKEEVKKYLEEMKQEMKEMKNEMGTLKAEIKKEIGELKTEIAEVKGSMTEMDGNMKVIPQNLQESEKRIKATEEKIQDMGQKVEEYKDHNYIACRGFDIAITNLELQSASHGLRFQNIEEERDEDLSAKMVEVKGEILQADPGELVREIDEVYRVQTGYVRHHNLPREIHIKFARRIIKDDILRQARNQIFKCNGKEIMILKQVPKRVREHRREYYILTSVLIQKNIVFRWLVPEGLTLTWQGMKVKMESVDQARSFFAQSGLDKIDQFQIERKSTDEARGATGGEGGETQIVKKKQPQVSQELVLDTRL
ncbi:uncharacterized protein PF3D7_1120000-like [Erythrolamprus reginae]|uniref:uncharacterized protein PF3D7_1120000-like n=1 Tax=Erythrolamprus reginae TaxID=121349 RepID=UPI00396C5D51